MNGETPTLAYRAWDATTGIAGTMVDASSGGGTASFSSLADTATLTVTAVNDAPVLTPASPSLGFSNLKTAIDFSLSNTFINHGAGTTTITDVDHGDAVGGIAVIGTSGYGYWSYSLNGTSFNTIRNINPSSALLLPNTALLCYTPDGVHEESPTITYRAWDASIGTAGRMIDTTNNGGNTAFSSSFDTAKLTLDYTPPQSRVLHRRWRRACFRPASPRLRSPLASPCQMRLLRPIIISSALAPMDYWAPVATT